MAELVTIFGGTGFIGRYVVQALLTQGKRVRVATRDPRSAWFLQPLAPLGNGQAVAVDCANPDSVARAVRGAGAVINLVGVLAGDFEGAHVRLAGAIARAAAEHGARALVHVSAIGADPDSESAYGRSKGLGEHAVLAAFPQARILRPSVVFGREDAFLNRFAAMIRGAPLVPVVRGATRFQPVFVGDVAQAVVTLLTNDPHRTTLRTTPQTHRPFELGGPEVLSMRALLDRLAAMLDRHPAFVDVPDGAAARLATLFGWLPGAPITRDQWLMLQRDNIVSVDSPGLEALGIAPTPIGAVAPEWLTRFHDHGRFGAETQRARRRHGHAVQVEQTRR